MNILFIAYQAASSSVMESQGLAYMKDLCGKGARYSLLTFETKETIGDSKNCITKTGMRLRWRHLKYHSAHRFLATCLDIFCGIFTAAFIIWKDRINVIHARGFISAVIAFPPARALGVRLLFDTRGLLADKYVGGGLLNKGSFTYKIMRRYEDLLVKKSDFFTIETHRHADIIRSSHSGLSDKMMVIPCCVDINMFNYKLCPANSRNGLSLVYMGKVGTWYLIEEMFDFFERINSGIENSHFTFITESKPEYLYSAARSRGIDESRILVKRAERQMVSNLLSYADTGVFFINPYKRYNSSPIKFGEYLACGLPVVINSGIGDCDEIVLKERIGVVINDFSSNEYDRAIKELRALLSEGEALKKRCRSIAEKYFSLEIGINRYWDIYNMLKN